MAILIVRHGQTIDNAKRILQIPESPLSDSGIQQTEQLANRLSTKNIQQLIVSDYLRTQQTAEIINKRIGVNIKLHKGLRERNFGDWRGLTYDSLKSNPLDQNSLPPNGETIVEFIERIANTWQMITDVANSTEGDLLVITHGLVCKAIAENFVLLDKDIPPPAHWGNTSLTVIESDLSKIQSWRVQLLNCTNHLSKQLLESSHNSAQV